MRSFCVSREKKKKKMPSTKAKRNVYTWRRRYPNCSIICRCEKSYNDTILSRCVIPRTPFRNLVRNILDCFCSEFEKLCGEIFSRRKKRHVGLIRQSMRVCFILTIFRFSTSAFHKIKNNVQWVFLIFTINIVKNKLCFCLRLLIVNGGNINTHDGKISCIMALTSHNQYM